MFRFSLAGVEVQCDDAQELRAALLNGSANGKAKRPKARRAKATTAAKPTGDTGAGKMPPDAEMPLIVGPLTWPKIDKAIKKAGFTGDKRQFRSALKRRQDMETQKA